MSDRTFKIQDPHMEGTDIGAWQEILNREIRRWGVRRNVLAADMDYGIVTRSLTSTVLKYMGFPQELMENGVTPWLRAKVRDRRFSVADRARLVARTADRRAWVRKQNTRVMSPVPESAIIADSWGWHPPVHDGLDIICREGTPLFAICRAIVIRADASGWWGKGAPSDPALKARGDGIIIIRAMETNGPIKDGMNLCYGHAEHASVVVHDVVQAGQWIGRAGFANAGHVHFMVNDNRDTRGVGDRDPRPAYDYARKHS